MMMSSASPVSVLLALACLMSISNTTTSAYADQTFLLTELGNLFLVEPPYLSVAPNGTVTPTPHMAYHTPEGFFLVGSERNAMPLVFQSSYHVPDSTANSHTIYAWIGDTDSASSTVPNHGPYQYRNGHLYLSSEGLPQVLGRYIPHQIFEGTPTYLSGTGYMYLGGNGTAAYSLKNIRYGGESIDHFLIERRCPTTPCGTVTLATSTSPLLRYTGALAAAPLQNEITLGNTPVIVTEDYYIIADTGQGPVRLRVVEYDPNLFEIRGMPPGMAYIIRESDSEGTFDWPPKAWASHGCCYTPHEISSALRAGIQRASSVISYDSDIISPSRGFRGDVIVEVYDISAQWSGRLAGKWLLADHRNDRLVSFSGSPAQILAPETYIQVPAAVRMYVEDVALGIHSCSGTVRYLPYLQGFVSAGEAISVPVIPRYDTICMKVNDVDVVLPYQDIIESVETLSLGSYHANHTISGIPVSIPCVACGYDIMRLSIDQGVLLHASTVAVKDGMISLHITGNVRYSVSNVRTWDTNMAVSDISHWSPTVTVRDQGMPVISVYQNGIHYDSYTVRCTPISHQSDSYRHISVSGISIYRWEWSYSHVCDLPVSASFLVPVSGGDILDVTLRIGPDIALGTSEVAGTQDAGYQYVSADAILIKSYR